MGSEYERHFTTCQSEESPVTTPAGTACSRQVWDVTLSTTPDTYLQHSQGHGESEQLTSSPKGPDCGWTQAARFPKPSPPHQPASARGRSQHGTQMLGETWEGSAPGSHLSPQPLLTQQPPGPHTQALSQAQRERGRQQGSS